MNDENYRKAKEELKEFAESRNEVVQNGIYSLLLLSDKFRVEIR